MSEVLTLAIDLGSKRTCPRCGDTQPIAWIIDEAKATSGCTTCCPSKAQLRAFVHMLVHYAGGSALPSARYAEVTTNGQRSGNFLVTDKHDREVAKISEHIHSWGDSRIAEHTLISEPFDEKDASDGPAYTVDAWKTTVLAPHRRGV